MSSFAADRLVLFDAPDLHLRRIRAHDRVLARMRARELDAELARGLAPEASWLRAVRAFMLTTPRSRGRLARRWVDMLDGASADIRRAEPAIRHLVDRLLDETPLPVRPVARAYLLIRGGAGHRGESLEFLAVAVAELVRHLPPG